MPGHFIRAGTMRFWSRFSTTSGCRVRARIRRLSGGERAQVSLALAVASDPELLILDDPTLGLDTVVRRDFLESLIQIIHRRGRTILFSSHILGDVERVADRIGILVDGVLRVDCPTEHFKESIRKVVLEFRRAAGVPGLSRVGEQPASRAGSWKRLSWALTTNIAAWPNR